MKRKKKKDEEEALFHPFFRVKNAITGQVLLVTEERKTLDKNIKEELQFLPITVESFVPFVYEDEFGSFKGTCHYRSPPLPKC